MTTKKPYVNLTLVSFYTIFLIVSILIDFQPGAHIGKNFISFAVDMFKLLPCAFILIGLFEVWVKQEKVEKHLGQRSSPMGYLWVMLLGSTTVGGLYVAFPVAASLFKKGAKLSIIFTYVGASGICRIPMTIFESSFLGIKFSLIRLIISIPLVILSSIWLGRFLEKRDYKVFEGN